MANELKHFPTTETGGLLLGYSDSEKGISIFEATDSGYQNTVHNVGNFQYDIVYENHLCNFLSELYQPPLQLVGVWHKHNSAYSGTALPFSHADENMHRQLLENPYPCISILFEKIREDQKNVHYDTRVFLISPRGDHQDITDTVLWSDTLSPEFSL